MTPEQLRDMAQACEEVVFLIPQQHQNLVTTHYIQHAAEFLRGLAEATETYNSNAEEAHVRN